MDELDSIVCSHGIFLVILHNNKIIHLKSDSNPKYHIHNYFKQVYSISFT